MIKKLSLLLLTVSMLFTLAACGGSKEAENTAQPPSGDAQAAGSLTESGDGGGSPAGGEEVQPTVLQGGSELESAEAVPLNVKLSGKTVREGELWYSFTTDGTENATYTLTTVNMTKDTGKLKLHVYDASENQMHTYALEADQSGLASTLSLGLLPNTTYYVKVWADRGDIIAYSLIIRSPDGRRPENNVAQSGPKAEEGQEFSAATNQDDAVLLPLEAKLAGKVKNNQGQWFAFSTDATENATYHLTTVNMTRDTGNLKLFVYDVYGEHMHTYALEADQSGRAATLDLDLSPDTTYYVYIWADKGDTIEYTLTIHLPDNAVTQG